MISLRERTFHVSGDDQWLEFDLGHPSVVTSLITKGRGDGSQDQWVTKYKVSFSNDTRLWLYYKDKALTEPKVSMKPE